MFLLHFPPNEEGRTLMDIHGVAPLLQVFGMPTAIRFYRDVLGFTIWGSSEAGDDCGCMARR
jgi:catechol 2,3-dioxygenase-like lactoylglutathione lyase family enzyme